jgi:D-alanine-D-alanine ligase-like ATP-grasp enzyme
MMLWSRTNQLIIAAAERLGVTAQPIASEHSDFFLRLSAPDGRSVIISKTRSPYLTEVAQTLSNNKFIARELLARHGLPVIAGMLLDESSDPVLDPQAREQAREFLAKHERVVVKPNWGNRGVGIVTDVRELADLLAAFAFARAHDRDEEVLLEPHVPGINVRVAVIGGRFAAAAEVQRPALCGDGRRSVAELVAELNADARRGRWDQPSLRPLDRIEDELVADLLEVRGLELETVLAAGERIELCFEEAEVIDRTDALHPGWIEVAVEAARLLGIDVAGVDLRGAADELFGAPPSAISGARLLEINVLPALHLHALPTRGTARAVFEQFVAYCVQLPGAPPPSAIVHV